MHAHVSHGDTVANAGQAEEERPTAPGMDALLNEPLEVAHADVAGDEVGEARGDADHGQIEPFPRDARGKEQRTVACSLDPFFYSIASHREAPMEK